MSTEYLRPPPSKFYVLRIGFSMDGSDRPVAFVLPRGDDLYWGPSTPGQYLDPVQISTGAAHTFAVPAGIEQLPMVRAKHSYHESGQTHLKIADQIAGEIGSLSRPAELTSPLLLATVITRRADEYQPGKALRRANSHALRLMVDQDSVRCRHQMEFWLSPPGEHQFPALWSVMLTADPAPAPAPQFTQSMSRNLILVIRHGVHEPGGFSDWEPDGEFWFTAHSPRTANPGPYSAAS